MSIEGPRAIGQGFWETGSSVWNRASLEIESEMKTKFISLNRIGRIAYDGETMWEKGIDPGTGPGKRAADIQDQDI